MGVIRETMLISKSKHWKVSAAHACREFAVITATCIEQHDILHIYSHLIVLLSLTALNIIFILWCM